MGKNQRGSPCGQKRGPPGFCSAQTFKPASWMVNRGPGMWALLSRRAESWEFLVTGVSQRDRSGLVT